MRTTKTGTVALVVQINGGVPQLVDQISDDREIAVLTEAYDEGGIHPLEAVAQLRARIKQEDEEFGNYVEELLSQPFVRPEIQDHGVQWLKSKLRIEEFQRSEAEATKVIAEYAFNLYKADPVRTDFILAGPVAKVHIKIFLLEKNSQHNSAA